MSEKIRLRWEIVQQPALKPRSPRRRTAPWQLSPASSVCLAVLTITVLGYWCLDHATLEARAKRGVATAQYRFGKQTLEAANTAGACAQAVEWIRLAANQGNANAQTALGQLYIRGFGVQRDYSEAAKWLRGAADQGAPVAQNELGIMYAKGMGMPQNFDQAIFWCDKAATQGSSIAKRNLALVEFVKHKFVADLTTSDGKQHRNACLQSIAPDGITVKLQPEPGSVVFAKLKVQNLTGHCKDLCRFAAKTTTNSAFSQLDSITVRL